MRRVLLNCAMALVVAGIVGSYARGDAPAPPAPDDAQKAYDTGQYADALKTAKRALAITGTAGAAYDRHALYMLCADSALHLKQSMTALDSLHAAQKESEKDDRTSEAAEAIAFAALIQASPNNSYTAKGEGASGKFDILDKTTRHQAYEAFFTELKGHCEARIQAAHEATSLTPILDVAKQFTVLRAVESAGSGNTKRSDVLAKQAETWAGNLITTTEDGFDQRITRIQIDSNVNALGKIRPRRQAGISDPDLATLHGIIGDCQKIPDAIKAFVTAFVRPNAMAHQIARAKDLADRADTTIRQNQKVGNGRS